MSTTFPTALDNYGADLTTETVDDSLINNPSDAVEAIEAKVGVCNSAIATSLDYLIKDLSSGHNHDGVNSKILDEIKVGDWIISTVTTPRVGFSNVSTTYADKFIRLNATPLGEGGLDTHSHAGGTYSIGNHTHASSYSGPGHTHGGTSGDAVGFNGTNYGDGGQSVHTNHTHSLGTSSSSGTQAVGGSTENTGGGSFSNSSSTESNIPIYIACTVFQKT